MIVRVRSGGDRAAAIDAAVRAARAAGATCVEPMAGQPLIVVEATPRQYEAIARSGTIESMQIDATGKAAGLGISWGLGIGLFRLLMLFSPSSCRAGCGARRTKQLGPQSPVPVPNPQIPNPQFVPDRRNQP